MEFLGGLVAHLPAGIMRQIGHGDEGKSLLDSALNSMHSGLEHLESRFVPLDYPELRPD